MSPCRMMTRPVSDGCNLSECIEEGGLKLYLTSEAIGKRHLGLGSTAMNYCMFLKFFLLTGTSIQLVLGLAIAPRTHFIQILKARFLTRNVSLAAQSKNSSAISSIFHSWSGRKMVLLWSVWCMKTKYVNLYVVIATISIILSINLSSQYSHLRKLVL